MLTIYVECQVINIMDLTYSELFLIPIYLSHLLLNETSNLKKIIT